MTATYPYIPDTSDQKSSQMTASTSPYNERDDAIMANYVFNELCRRDQEDRRNGREPAWHNLTLLADEMRAYNNRIDAAYIAEVVLLDRRGFIERDIRNENVRLTEEGRQNCGRGIDIPPSDIQRLRRSQL